MIEKLVEEKKVFAEKNYKKNVEDENVKSKVLDLSKIYNKIGQLAQLYY